MRQILPDNSEPILLVYIGTRIGRNDKPLDWWLEVSRAEFEDGKIPAEDLQDDKYRVYTAKLTKKYMRGSPGAVYEVPQEKGTTKLYSGMAEYVGLWPDEEQRMEWQADHRTAVTFVNLQKRKSKEFAADNFASLRPFRRAYSRLVSQDQRAAMLAQVVAYLTARRVQGED